MSNPVIWWKNVSITTVDYLGLPYHLRSALNDRRFRFGMVIRPGIGLLGMDMCWDKLPSGDSKLYDKYLPPSNTAHDDQLLAFTFDGITPFQTERLIDDVCPYKWAIGFSVSDMWLMLSVAWAKVEDSIIPDGKVHFVDQQWIDFELGNYHVENQEVS